MKKAARTQSRVSAPVFRDLTRKETEKLLERNHIGRIGFSFHDAVDIRPIGYVYSKGWIFGRTSEGDKLVTLRHNQWVAFEVDEVEGPLDWKSVIAHGTFYRLEPEGNEFDVRLYQKGLGTLRSVAPVVLTSSDPVPFRTEIFGISVDSMSGRSCSSSPAKRTGKT